MDLDDSRSDGERSQFAVGSIGRLSLHSAPNRRRSRCPNLVGVFSRGISFSYLPFFLPPLIAPCHTSAVPARRRFRPPPPPQVSSHLNSPLPIAELSCFLRLYLGVLFDIFRSGEDDLFAVG